MHQSPHLINFYTTIQTLVPSLIPPPPPTHPIGPGNELVAELVQNLLGDDGVVELDEAVSGHGAEGRQGEGKGR